MQLQAAYLFWRCLGPSVLRHSNCLADLESRAPHVSCILRRCEGLPLLCCLVSLPCLSVFLCLPVFRRLPGCSALRRRIIL